MTEHDRGNSNIIGTYCDCLVVKACQINWELRISC